MGIGLILHKKDDGFLKQHNMDNASVAGKNIPSENAADTIKLFTNHVAAKNTVAV
jgi:hypothetical protein